METTEVTTIPEALLNTLIGMGTVFTVLILISFIIYLMKFIPMLLNRKQEIKRENVQTPPVADRPVVPKKEPESVPAQEEDTARLIAVIAAAVAAQMQEETGVPVAPDGLVIRSIKKRTFSL
jgi:sodium pump decarboxylase gamma subunit